MLFKVYLLWEFLVSHEKDCVGKVSSYIYMYVIYHFFHLFHKLVM